MKLRYKIGLGILGVLAIAVVSLAFLLSYESSCEPVPPVASSVETMRAITGRCYGSSDVLALEELTGQLWDCLPVSSPAL